LAQPFYFFFFFFFSHFLLVFFSFLAERDVFFLKPCPHSVAQLAHACLVRYIQRMQITAAQRSRNGGADKRARPAAAQPAQSQSTNCFPWKRPTLTHTFGGGRAAHPGGSVCACAVLLGRRHCFEFQGGTGTDLSSVRMVAAHFGARRNCWRHSLRHSRHCGERRGAAKLLPRRAAKPPASDRTF
jgi:hypothetical protein